MSIKNELESRAYAEVPTAITQPDIEELFAAYDQFISLSRDTKHAGDYRLHHLTNGIFGYFRRVGGSEEDGRSTSIDTKHAYHFGSQTRQQFETSGSLWLPEEIRTFCDISEEIYWQSVAAFRKFLRDLHDETSEYGRQNVVDLEPWFIDSDHPLNIHQRIVASERPKNPLQPITEHHFDRSVFSMHHAADQPGLEIGFAADGSDLRPVTQTIGRAAVFAGAGWPSMPMEVTDTYDFLRPAYHGVEQPPDTIPTTAKIARRALVTFFNPYILNTDPNYQETHPQLQTPQMIAAA